MMSKDVSDRLFAERAMARLAQSDPGEPLSPRLEAALLAAYDAWQAERARGPWAAFKAGLRDFCHTIWPGVPVWAPAAAFTASLLVGVMLGVFLLPPGETESQAFSLEQPQDFSLLSDAAQEDL